MAYVQLTPSITTVPLPMRFAGLDPDRRYRCTVIEDLGSMFEFGRARPAWMAGEMVKDAPGTEGTVFSGAQLMASGLQPPVLHPESVVLLELEALPR